MTSLAFYKLGMHSVINPTHKGMEFFHLLIFLCVFWYTNVILFYFYAASPPQIFSTSELLEAANELSKMTIAHEIVVNHDFRFQEANFLPNR